MLTDTHPKYIECKPTYSSKRKFISRSQWPLIWTHLNYGAFKYSYFIELLKYKAMVQIRDLRDIIISYANWLLKDKYASPKMVNDLKNLSFDEKITYVINLDFLKKCTKDLEQWVNNPNILSVKFEDLVGSEGKGSFEDQKKTILKIATHMDTQIDEEKLSYIQKNLFGKKINDKFDSVTFFSGQIGTWKSVFNENHKKLFKKIYGNILVLLGYEKNNDW